MNYTVILYCNYITSYAIIYFNIIDKIKPERSKNCVLSVDAKFDVWLINW